MTQEEKELLIKDLCSRLPYCVEAQVSNNIDGETKSLVINKELTFDDVNSFINNDVVCDIKPYLRPMSSMTEEEKEYIKNRWCYEDWYDIYDFLNNYKIDAGDTYAFIDWLNKNMFDYRGLIEKGLALEALEDMYKKIDI